MAHKAFLITLGIASIAMTACGGGGNAAMNPLPGAASTAPDTHAASVAASLTVTAYGGLRGTAYAAHHSGDTFDYAEDVTVDFDRVVAPASIASHLSIAPAAPLSTYVSGYGKRVQITVRKVPGTAYTLTLSAGLAAQDGTTLAVPSAFAFKTPITVAIPAPIRSTLGEPYRYGSVERPFSYSLAGGTADQQIAVMASAGARFARIDYPASQIEPQRGQFAFGTEDAILAKLAAKGITEMPIIEQYSVPAWASGGAPYPATFTNPADFAAYAGTIVSHLRAVAPQVTHVELFNEPNLDGWWTNTNALYAGKDGSATAAYAQAAYAAIKAANPAMIVVGPALGDGGPTIDPRTFLTTMMQHGCRVGTCWDALSVHTYRWSDPTYSVDPAAMNRFTIYQDLQRIALANGDTHIPHVFITEWAFSTDPSSASSFDPKVQARFLALGFNLMLSDPTVDGIVWTNLYNPNTDFWGRTALTNPDFSPLPGLATYRAFATH